MEAIELLDLVVEHENDDRRFQAALHGVRLDEAGRPARSGLRSFHDRMKQRMRGGHR